MSPISDLAELLRSLQPERNAGTFVFATLAANQAVSFDDVVVLVRETEGVSVVVEERLAKRLGLTPASRCAWITLTFNSDLHAVGLTAAFASALGDAAISCNGVAGMHHAHIFVPIEQAEDPMSALGELQQRQSGGNHQ